MRSLERRAKKLKRQLWALFLSWKDPSTPFLAKAVIAVAVAYAVSPIDLIPDFIPVLGQLDDLLILPALIAVAIKLIPPEVLARNRREAWKQLESGSRIKTRAGFYASFAIIVLWLAVIGLVTLKVYRLYRK